MQSFNSIRKTGIEIIIYRKVVSPHWLHSFRAQGPQFRARCQYVSSRADNFQRHAWRSHCIDCELVFVANHTEGTSGWQPGRELPYFILYEISQIIPEMR